MPNLARLKSILKADRFHEDTLPEESLTQSDTLLMECRIVHDCVCGNAMAYALIEPGITDFGYTRGLHMDHVWIPGSFARKSGHLPMFSKVFIADNEHLEFKCEVCRRISQVQLSYDGGILPLGNMRMVHVNVPLKKIALSKDRGYDKEVS